MQKEEASTRGAFIDDGTTDVTATTTASNADPATPHPQESATTSAADASDEPGSGGSDLEVFDDSEEDTRPTIKIECEKCGNDEAVWWMLQTRSADEPTTQFYRCNKCQYTWRDYS